MLVEEVATPPELIKVQCHHELQVGACSSDPFFHHLGMHPRVVKVNVQPAPIGARRAANENVGLLLADSGTCFSTVICPAEIP